MRADVLPGAGNEARLAALGLTLPVLPDAIGRFAHGRIENGLLFLSGQGPVLESGELARGKVGRDVSVEAARTHAMRTGLTLLAAMRAVAGDLDRIESVVKLLGFVNAVEGFADHASIVDGASELFERVFGPGGVHARSAIGVASLPGNITVEIEAIVRVRE